MFQRLTKHFQAAAMKFRQFVEEQDPVMGERDFAGSRRIAAANHAGVADSFYVVGIHPGPAIAPRNRPQPPYGDRPYPARPHAAERDVGGRKRHSRPGYFTSSAPAGRPQRPCPR
jgi:hypothetical protein